MSLEDIVSKQQKIMGYIKQDKETARKLTEAKGDLNKIRSVLKESATDDFIQGIVDTPHYQSWTIDVADQIMSQFPEVVAETQDKLLGLIKPKKKVRRKKYVKKIKSKTSSGKEYFKGYKKWSNQEITFLKSRKNIPRKQLIEEYNNFFSDSPRSESSILTKFYRVKK